MYLSLRKDKPVLAFFKTSCAKLIGVCRHILVIDYYVLGQEGMWRNMSQFQNVVC